MKAKMEILYYDEQKQELEDFVDSYEYGKFFQFILKNKKEIISKSELYKLNKNTSQITYHHFSKYSWQYHHNLQEMYITNRKIKI